MIVKDTESFQHWVSEEAVDTTGSRCVVDLTGVCSAKISAHVSLVANSLKKAFKGLLSVWSTAACFPVILFVIVSHVLCLLALHTNYHTYNIHELKCFSGPGDALHAEGVHHHLPPWAKRPETETQLQGCGHSSDHVVTALAQTQRQAQRRSQNRAVWERRPKQ